MKRSGPLDAVITVAVLLLIVYVHRVLVLVPGYMSLHASRPFYIAESIDKVLGVALCLAALWLARGIGFRGAVQEFGLSSPVGKGLFVGAVASLPMLIGFAATRSVTPHLNGFRVLFLCFFAPFVEEVDFRGFGIRQLQRGTQWPFWVALWPSVLLTGIAHFEQGDNVQEMIGLLLLTTAGGIVFAWLLYRWKSLWVPFALHACMNLWWTVFSVANTALGGWFPFAMQTLAMATAVLITIKFTTVDSVERTLMTVPS